MGLFTVAEFFCTVKGLAMIGLVFLSLLVCSQAALTPTAKVQLSVAEKLMIAEDLQDDELVQDVEALIAGLDDATLVKLQKILSDDLTIDSELQLIESELTEMGMEVEDIKDLLDLSALMADFLSKVPEVEELVKGDGDYTIEDNVKLYLLGLPNKLGPLGFLALHSVLESDASDIVDVKIGSFVPNTPVDTAEEKVETGEKKADDIVAEIIARRKRSARTM